MQQNYTFLSPYIGRPPLAPPSVTLILLLVKGIRIPSKVKEVNRLAAQGDAILSELSGDLLKAQDQMRTYANKPHWPADFKIEEWGFLNLQPYIMKILARRPNVKLSPQFYGPNEIVVRIRQVTYKLNLPELTEIHPFFHVSRLQIALGPDVKSEPLPPILEADG